MVRSDVIAAANERLMDLLAAGDADLVHRTGQGRGPFPALMAQMLRERDEIARRLLARERA